mmetsp:Transcript_14113/g.30648  ORF Transcript_14113/g.30648 Transcript_14113/m.30648 type:complete len:149 (-) Transcript_14113:136-582(-)
MAACMIAGAIRFSGYLVATSGWALLPFEVGHGFTFAMSFTVMSVLAEEVAPDGLQATMIGALNSASQVGRIGAVMGWGVVMESAGMRAGFGFAAIIFVAATLLMLFARVSDQTRAACTRRGLCCLLRPSGKALLPSAARSTTVELRPA